MGWRRERTVLYFLASVSRQKNSRTLGNDDKVSALTPYLTDQAGEGRPESEGIKDPDQQGGKVFHHGAGLHHSGHAVGYSLEFRFRKRE